MQERRRTVIMLACIAMVGIALLAAQPLLVDPLPEITRPDVGEPRATQRGYGVLGQEWGYLSGINDHGNFIQAIGDAVAAQSQMLVGLLVGLCFVVGFILQPRLSSDRGLGTGEASLLAGFILAAVGSGYCAYRAHLAFLAQASEAVVYFEGLEAPLAAQALFLLGATGLAVMLAARALSGRARVRDNTAPATDPVTTGVREPQGTVGEAPALSGGPASDPNAVGSARRDAGEAGRDQEGPA